LADLVYHSFFHQLMLAAHDLTTTTGTQLVLQLHTTSHTPDVDDAVRTDLDNEVAAAGNYDTGGLNITKGAMAPADDDGNDRAAFDITEDPTWSAATITAYYAILVDEDHGSDALVCLFDFGGNKTSTAGDFKIQFNAAGLFTIA
jgi:hypothetical protein